MVALGELIIAPSPAAAREARAGIDIPPGLVTDSLSALSRLTGISVGLGGSLPQFHAPRVSRASDAREALHQLLAGSGYHAVEVGPMTWRIEPDARPPAAIHPAPQAVPAVGEAAPAPEIIVTGQKRRQELMDVPMSLTVIQLGDRPPIGILAGSRDIALDAEGLALTNLGPGRNRQFIRGVADSPFTGASQATVAVQLDEARLIFDAPDPDLRLIDMERVELLKGPQGPLYGSGALGGIYHLVTRKPELDRASASARLIAEAVEHGGLGVGGEATINLPLERDLLGLRANFYDLRSAGWIDRAGDKRDANTGRNLGGRLALRWRPATGWTVDVGVVAQNLNVADSQYVTEKGALRRAGTIAEPTDNDFREAYAAVEGLLGTLRLVSATSYIDHGVDYTLDASAAASQFNLTAPLRFRDMRHYRLFNQELRLTPASDGQWLIGASFLRAQSRSIARLKEPSATALQLQRLDRIVLEYALFGEVTLPIAERFAAVLGGRIYRTTAEDEAIEGAADATKQIDNTAFAPSVELSWRPQSDSLVYLRYARALRPGGLATADQSGSGRFDSDALGTIDFGFRRPSRQRRIGIAASLYYTDWNHIQSDYLLNNGLVGTRNAGRGQIYGGEASIDWQPTGQLRLAAGINLQRARLTHTEQGVDVDDRRLPIAPALTARLGLRYDLSLADGWQASLTGQANYIGKARLAFDQALDRRMGKYAVTGAGATFTHDHLTVALRLDNLFDARGDSFAFGNQFTIMSSRQYTPLRPRSFTISLGRNW